MPEPGMGGGFGGGGFGGGGGYGGRGGRGGGRSSAGMSSSRGFSSGGRQDGPGSESEGNQYATSSNVTASEQNLLDAINNAISSGVNPNSDTFQNVLASGILSGQFGSPQSFGVDQVDFGRPEVAGFMNRYGPESQSFENQVANMFNYDRTQSLMQNVANKLTPGVQTPLGILSMVPTVLSLPSQVQQVLTGANLGIGAAQRARTPEAQEQSAVSKAVEAIFGM